MRTSSPHTAPTAQRPSSLEAVEAYKKKFNAAYAECAHGIEPGSDQLGPKPFTTPNLMQHGGRDVNYYIDEAERLYPRFVREILDVVASKVDPGGSGESITVLSNLKRREVRERWTGVG